MEHSDATKENTEWVYTAQELSANDYGRIDWGSIAEDLL